MKTVCNLKELKFHKHYSQYDLMVITGIPQSTISLIENGYIDPKDEVKEKLANALECAVEDIFPKEVSDVEPTESSKNTA